MATVRPESQAWQDYRKRRFVFLALFLGSFPGVFVIAVPLNILFRSQLPFYVIAVGWIFLTFIVYLRFALFPCPQCGHPYFSRWWYYNPLANSCVHCGLSKWQELDPAAAYRSRVK
jgi:hypothetical protein